MIIVIRKKCVVDEFSLEKVAIIAMENISPKIYMSNNKVTFGRKAVITSILFVHISINSLKKTL